MGPARVPGRARDSIYTRFLQSLGIHSASSGSDFAYYELRATDDILEEPTDEERNSLSRVADSIPWNAYRELQLPCLIPRANADARGVRVIAFIELAERFSYYGTTVVFTNFLQQPLPPHSRTGAGYADGQSGALGLGQRASSAIGTFNAFWVYLIPLFGAYIADTRWGRFKTICIAVAIALFGHALLVVSAIPGIIEHQKLALVYFLVALIIMGVGTGGFKANISPLVAEQYKQTKLFVRVNGNGDRVIIDPALTTSRIYMYFYLFINIGALVGQIGMTYSEKYVGFWLAYSLPTVIFLLCPIVLFLGRDRYVKSPPSGSVLGTAWKVWRFGMKGKWSLNPYTTYQHMTAPKFWDGVKPSRLEDSLRPEWMAFDDQWIEELKRGLQACEVFLWYPIYFLVLGQLGTNLTSQAATMATHGIPNDVLSNLDPLILVIFIPLCDFYVYPALRRAGVRWTPLRKISLGFMTGSAGMFWAATVQYFIYRRNPCGNNVATCVDADGKTITSDVNIWWQTGCYILVAFSEILASITGLEYAYTKAPKNMRSLVMAVFLFMSAVASAIGEAFVALSADPLLVWNYSLMCALAAVSGLLFWRRYQHLDANEDEMNNLSEGHLHSPTHGDVT
ncbi:uncharacterized protein FIBRA_05600 [Fibroporia radiculosa]|uniref:Uncharacterized protein n=1 Tax=Fibroporia radiculosa TaxID=599839 RepID=J4HXT5_9APHY|nr:uncharacterized protein FIBRA_05600 [Fibroporia radiculosa]CCM03467.1 predicted protein [Fibroporia radiculosa]